MEFPESAMNIIKGGKHSYTPLRDQRYTLLAGLNVYFYNKSWNNFKTQLMVILPISTLQACTYSPVIAFSIWYSTPDQRTIKFASLGTSEKRRELLQVFHDNRLISPKQSTEHFINSFCAEQTLFKFFALL